MCEGQHNDILDHNLRRNDLIPMFTVVVMRLWLFVTKAITNTTPAQVARLESIQVDLEVEDQWRESLLLLCLGDSSHISYSVRVLGSVKLWHNKSRP